MPNNDAGYPPPTPWPTLSPVPTVTPGTIQPSPPPQQLADTGLETGGYLVVTLALVIVGIWLIRKFGRREV